MAVIANPLIRMLNILAILAFFQLALSCPVKPSDSVAIPAHEPKEYDVVILGATPAGIAAALQARRMKKTAAIVTSEKHIGGLMTSGLGWTDSKNGEAIGGIAKEFFAAVHKHYIPDSAWTEQSRHDYEQMHIAAQPGPAIDDRKHLQWTFEPHVAEQIFNTWLKDSDITVYLNEPLNRNGGVKMKKKKIESITTLSQKEFKAKMFIDATYLGDLMATANIPYRLGRESVDEFDESFAGVRIGAKDEYKGIDPYVKKNDEKSGLLPGLKRSLDSTDDQDGKKDGRLQSYNYRLSLTKNKDKVKFFKPDGYDVKEYELLLRYIEAGAQGPFFTDQLMPNGKTDTNAQGKVSTDLMGGNYDVAKKTNYVEETDEEREKIADHHKKYAQGFFYTLTTNERISKRIRDAVAEWGYASDEWKDNGNWPYEIYIREARRMNGIYTVTQKDAQSAKDYKDDVVVGLACYSLDVHQVERVVIDGEIYDEGLIHETNPTPFAIPYKSLIPQESVATNFLNPVTLSSTHVAFAAIRMEPTWMILGQSAATAAVLAIEKKVHVQDVDPVALTKQLEKDNQKLKM